MYPQVVHIGPRRHASLCGVRSFLKAALVQELSALSKAPKRVVDHRRRPGRVCVQGCKQVARLSRTRRRCGRGRRRPRLQGLSRRWDGRNAPARRTKEGPDAGTRVRHRQGLSMCNENEAGVERRQGAAVVLANQLGKELPCVVRARDPSAPGFGAV